jgi:hypothetical protein
MNRTVLAILIGIAIVGTVIYMLVLLNAPVPEAAKPVEPSHTCAGFKVVQGVVKGNVYWPARADGSCHKEDSPEPVQ